MLLPMARKQLPLACVAPSIRRLVAVRAAGTGEGNTNTILETAETQIQILQGGPKYPRCESDRSEATGGSRLSQALPRAAPGELCHAVSLDLVDLGDARRSPGGDLQSRQFLGNLPLDAWV